MTSFGIVNYSFSNAVVERGVCKLTDVDYDYMTSLGIYSYDRVLALGNFASTVLKKMGVDHFVLPHPSPRNRVLNDGQRVNEILNECKRYVCDGNGA